MYLDFYTPNLNFETYKMYLYLVRHVDMVEIFKEKISQRKLNM